MAWNNAESFIQGRCVCVGVGGLPEVSQDRAPASRPDLLSIVPGWDRKHFLFPIACVD